MGGESVAADFGNRFAAEIRLPEALEEKLLCPFQYFAVADPISVAADNFWKNGRYDVQALERVYIGSSPLAQQRVETVLEALSRYEPDLSQVRGIGFCVSVSHAEFMAAECNRRGIKSAVLVGETEDQDRTQRRLNRSSRGNCSPLGAPQYEYNYLWRFGRPNGQNMNAA